MESIKNKIIPYSFEVKKGNYIGDNRFIVPIPYFLDNYSNYFNFFPNNEFHEFHSTNI